MSRRALGVAGAEAGRSRRPGARRGHGGPGSSGSTPSPGMAARLRREVVDHLETIREAASRQRQAGPLLPLDPQPHQHSTRFITGRDERASRTCCNSFEVRSLIVVALRAGGRTIGGAGAGPLRERRAVPRRGLRHGAGAGPPHRAGAGIRDAAKRISSADVDHGPSLGDAIRKWVRVFDLAVVGSGGRGRRRPADRHASIRPSPGCTATPIPRVLTGRLFSDLLPPERTGELERMADRSSGGQPTRRVHLRGDGTTVPVLVSVTPLDDRRTGRRPTW